MDVLIIYQFCTFGGVERVVLNRAKAFKEYAQDVKISVGYLHDSGALESFKTYIHIHGLEDHLSAFLINKGSLADIKRYDYIFVIDTPQVFDQISDLYNVYIECHTPYVENRKYLRKLPSNVRGILVPSKSFKAVIGSEVSNLPPVFVMPNPVSKEFFEFESLNNIYFAKRPLVYFARLDKLKNFDEVVRIFERFVADDDIMYIVIGNGANEKSLIQSLEQRELLSKTLLRSQIDFDKAHNLVNTVKHHRGIFLSSSRGESFGFSAAEFISGGVPVLLSDIPPHYELVEGDKRFLYPLGDLQAAKQKLIYLLQNWEVMNIKISEYADKFRGDTFIKAWQNFIGEKNI